MWKKNLEGNGLSDCNLPWFQSVQFSYSVVSDSLRPVDSACQASLSITNSWSLLKLMSIESSSHLILCHPLLLLPSIFLASGSFQMSQFFASGGQNIGTSASASVFQMNIQDFRMDWLDLLAVQGTLKSLLQHHSSEASILWHSAFFIVQLSHSYMTTRKTLTLTRQAFAGKVMSDF